MPRGAAAALAAIVVVLVLVATLTPAGGAPAEPSVCGIVCGDLALADAILNLLFFVPVGLAFRLAMRPWRAIAGGLLLSLVVETVQLLVPGRHASLGDLLFNTLGTVAGVLLLAALPRLLRPSRREALALACGWSCLVALGLVAAVWLLQPALPATTYYGMWTPDLEGSEHYRGEVLEARVGGRAIPSWRLDDSEGVRALLESSVPLDLTMVVGPTPRDPSPIFTIGDEFQREIVAVSARGNDLVYRTRVRASYYMLHRPDLRVYDAFAHREGDTLRIDVSPAVVSGPIRIRIGELEHEARFSVADTWGLLVWPEFVARSPGLRRVVGTLWLLGLALPAVAWATRALLLRRRPASPT